MNHFSINENLISDSNGYRCCYIDLAKVVETLSSCKSIDKKCRVSTRVPRVSEAFMRTEAKNLNIAYSSYYNQLKDIEEKPFDKQFPELYQIYQDISLQFDPPMYCEDAYDYADTLSSSEYFDASEEFPPFACMTLSDPAYNLTLAQAKMLYLYKDVRDQLLFRLKKALVKKKNKIKFSPKTKEKGKTKIPDERKIALRNLGRLLEEWYEDYHNRLSKYEDKRQLNALKNMRKQVLRLKNDDGTPYINNPDNIDLLILSSSKRDYYPRLKDFECNFIRKNNGERVDFAWEDPLPEKQGYENIKPAAQTYAGWGLLFFWSALNYEIDRLQDLQSYDQPVDDDSGEVTPDHSSANRRPRTFKVGEEKARKMFYAAKKVKWLSDEVDLDEWMYRLAGLLPEETDWQPSTEPILFNRLNQIYYISKNYIYDPGKNMTDKQWTMVKEVFKAKKGDINNVNYRSKTPKGFDDFDKEMRK